MSRSVSEKAALDKCDNLRALEDRWRAPCGVAPQTFVAQARSSSRRLASKPTTICPFTTVTGVVIHPSFCSSSNAVSSTATFRSTKDTPFC